MSGDASRARSTGPFVQIVASATWFSAIDGVLLDGQLELDRAGPSSWRSSLPSFSSA